MKCISIKPEFVTEILEGSKTKEYRAWSTNYRGDLLIACTKTETSNPFICAIVKIVDCIKEDGVYAFILDDIRGIKPLPVKGKQRVYNVDYNEEDIEVLDPNDVEYIDKVYNEADKWITIS